MSKSEMARLFQCDEKTIRNDINLIKTEKAELVREDTDVKLIIADLLEARDKALRECERAKRAYEVEEGGRGLMRPGYLKAVELALNIHLKVTEALQNMGWLPKNIGAITINKQVFKSFVDARTGGVETRPIDLFDDIREGESFEEMMRRKADEQKAAIQDAEFVDLPQLPERSETDAADSEDGHEYTRSDVTST